MSKYGIEKVLLARIVKSRWQPRGAAFDAEELWELACSIKENGLINQVIVFPAPADDHGMRYELVAGERRARAMGGLALGAALDNHTPKEYVERLDVVLSLYFAHSQLNGEQVHLSDGHAPAV